MQKFDLEQLQDFLAAIDRKLTREADLLIIGGAAALLGYGIDGTTQDIDTWHSELDAIREQLESARRETGVFLTFHRASVADAPYDFEDRLVLLDLPRLARLRIHVPEKHDLVLMKTLRGYEHDFQMCEAIHANHGLDLTTLLRRYTEQMSHVVGDPERLDGNLLAMVARLFGDSGLAVAEPAIRRYRNRA
jgi:hypothetical protein